MNIGKILFYNDENNDVDINQLKTNLSCNEIVEVQWIKKYLYQCCISIESMCDFDDYKIFKVDDSATSKLIIYTGNVIGALEFDDPDFIDFVHCIQLKVVNSFLNNVDNYMALLWLHPFNSIHVDRPNELIEELKVNLVNLFYTPNLMEDPDVRLKRHLSLKW
jgi:hypothetical protein